MGSEVNRRVNIGIVLRLVVQFVRALRLNLEQGLIEHELQLWVCSDVVENGVAGLEVEQWNTEILNTSPVHVVNGIYETIPIQRPAQVNIVRPILPLSLPLVVAAFKHNLDKTSARVAVF